MLIDIIEMPMMGAWIITIAIRPALHVRTVALLPCDFFVTVREASFPEQWSMALCQRRPEACFAGSVLRAEDRSLNILIPGYPDKGSLVSVSTSFRNDI
jgi:hypothetical protein